MRAACATALRGARRRACWRAAAALSSPPRLAHTTASTIPLHADAGSRARPAAAAAAALLLGGGAALWAGLLPGLPGGPPVPGGETTLVNWSNTHEVSTAKFYQPESVAALERLVAWAHAKGQRLRPIGNALSPNGLGFCEEGMVSLALCDKVLSMDAKTGRIAVQAGARLSIVLDELRRHGWTLQNMASIKEQQVGGWIQAGCHGTGATLPPVEEQVVSLKLVTPGRGTLVLSNENEPELFRMAKCGLGALGVVAEVELQAVPIEPLAEQTTVSTLKQVKRNHAHALKANRHLRYMWLPYTDTVVVVTVNPLSACPAGTAATAPAPDSYRLQPLRALLRKVQPDIPDTELQGMSFADIRDRIIAFDPLSVEHVKRCNAAEAEFWKRSEGWRVGDNESLLGFECGGEQWVSECAFATGTLERPTLADIKFIEDTVELINQQRIPAPAPIEQRWTSTSTAAMSPASAADAATVHSWVGIIMYLPTQEPAQRKAITDAFVSYREAWQDKVQTRYGAVDHWAKVEVPLDDAKRDALRAKMQARFPVAQFNAARRQLDPKNILANRIVDGLFLITTTADTAATQAK